MIEADKTYRPHDALAAADAITDAGLRAYMLSIYNKVAGGLLLSAAVAFATSGVPGVRDHLVRAAATAAPAHPPVLTGLGLAVLFGPLLAMLFVAPVFRRPTAGRTAALYWSVAALVGGALGLVTLSFTGVSVAMAFTVTALAFGSLSLFGYTAKRDLTAFGGFLLMGVTGLIGALVLNLVLHSPLIALVTNAVGVLVFGGLVARDTQRLKLAYASCAGDPELTSVTTNSGALSLFLNFINFFQFLLLMSGDRR
ncbi:Bax inhibitor-1/YccA family protein [Phenylobacterium sp.]|uniref:Bax inhibitor-1/YccA family protein n=1 Tax=Phenylobacterium sp. TaxID=1871053 RepID=UPI00356572A9